MIFWSDKCLIKCTVSTSTFMQYKANSLPVNNVAESYIESHLNFGTLLILRDIFYIDFESNKQIEQIFNNYDLISNVTL